MPIKGKGKVSKQTNKLESIVSGAFSVGLLAAEPFFVYRVLMISKQRISKQTENWGVYLIHLMYCFYWKEKLRLTWRHSSVQCQICCRSNTSPDCLSLKFLRVGSAVWAACWVVESVCGVSDVNHHQSSSCLKTIIDKILWELSLILKCKQKEAQIPGVVWWTWKKSNQEILRDWRKTWSTTCWVREHSKRYSHFGSECSFVGRAHENNHVNYWAQIWVLTLP